MSLEKIVASILANSKADEQNILLEARADARAVMDEASHGKAKILENYRIKTEKTISMMKERAEAGMEIDEKKEILSIRRQILEDMFNRVLEHFSNLPDASKQKLYSAMAARLLTEFTRGRIHCRRDEAHLLGGIGQFSMGEPIDTAGGFLAENDDGTLVMDMRFEVLLKDLWDRNLDIISGLLFEDGEAQ